MILPLHYKDEMEIYKKQTNKQTLYHSWYFKVHLLGHETGNWREA